MFLPLCLLLVLGLTRPVSSVPYEIITAQPGDNVTLVCDVPIVNATVALVVIKHERDGGYDFICNKPDAEKGFNDDCMRLYNVQMEGGYVRVRIKNVSIRSTGIYECRFIIDEMVTDSDGNNTLDTLSNYIVLVVPDQAAGEDGRGDFSNKGGGNKDKGSINGKHEDLSNEDGGHVSGLLDLIGLVLRIVPFVVVVTVAVAVVMIFRKRKRQAALNVGQPPADGVNETLV